MDGFNLFIHPFAYNVNRKYVNAVQTASCIECVRLCYSICWMFSRIITFVKRPSATCWIFIYQTDRINEMNVSSLFFFFLFCSVCQILFFISTSRLHAYRYATHIKLMAAFVNDLPVMQMHVANWKAARISITFKLHSIDSSRITNCVRVCVHGMQFNAGIPTQVKSYRNCTMKTANISAFDIWHFMCLCC